MTKNKIWDITPEGWELATAYQRSAAVAQVMRCSDFAREMHITKKTLVVACYRDVGEGGVQALANIIQSIVKGSKEEADIRKEIAELCCRDTSCHFWPEGVPRGQTTNGGCRCFRDVSQEYRMKAVRLIQLYKLLAAQQAKGIEGSIP
jgi:hypothetical protein